MRKIVGARIGTRITNNRQVIAVAIETGMISEFLDQQRMQLMASFDLGPEWTAMAQSPVLFQLDDDDKPYPADYKESQ